MKTDDFILKFSPVQFPGAPEFPFRFELAVPVDCRIDSTNLVAANSSDGFSPLGFFTATGSRRFEVVVLASVLPREMNAGDLAEISADVLDGKVLQRRDWESTKGCQAEIFTSFEKGSETWLRHTRVLKDGSRVFRVDAAVPEADYVNAAEDCAITVMSFRLLEPDKACYAENLEKCSLAQPLPFSFRYPRSWRFRDVFNSEDHTKVAIDNILKQGIHGTVTVEVHLNRANVPSARYLRAFAQHIGNDGVRLSGAPVVQESPPKDWTAAYVFAPPASRDGRDLSVGGYLLERSDALAIIGIVSPSRVTGKWIWAINKRAFEIVRDSLCVVNPGG